VRRVAQRTRYLSAPARRACARAQSSPRARRRTPQKSTARRSFAPMRVAAGVSWCSLPAAVTLLPTSARLFASAPRKHATNLRGRGFRHVRSPRARASRRHAAPLRAPPFLSSADATVRAARAAVLCRGGGGRAEAKFLCPRVRPGKTSLLVSRRESAMGGDFGSQTANNKSRHERHGGTGQESHADPRTPPKRRPREGN